MAKFLKVHGSNRGTSSYQAEGYSGTIYLGKAAFNGEHPEFLEIADVPAEAKSEAKPVREKLTAEQKEARKLERKAALATMTPAQKAQAKVEKARKAVLAAEARAAKLGLDSASA